MKHKEDPFAEKAPGGMTVEEMRAKHREYTAETRDLIAKSQSESRALTSVEQKRFDDIEIQVKSLRDEMRHREITGDMSPRNGVGPLTVERNSSNSRNSEDGSEVRALRPDESMVDHLSSRGVIDDRLEGLSLGRYFRAMAVGARSEVEKRALSEGTDSAGGYTVPSVLAGQLLDRMRPLSTVLRAGARMVALDSDSHSFAKVASDPTPDWRAENVELDESEPTFTKVEFAPKTVAVIARASRELIEDSINLATELPNIFARVIASEIDRVALVGSGSGSEPTGLAAMSGGINEQSMGANGAAITNYDDFLDLIQKIQEDNHPSPTAAIMAPRTATVLAKLKAATTNQPLQRPPALNDVRFLVTSQVPITQTQGTETDASSIYMGGFENLWIGFRPTEIRIEILKERYADFLQVAYLCWARLDIQASYEPSMGRIVGIIPA